MLFLIMPSTLWKNYDVTLKMNKKHQRKIFISVFLNLFNVIPEHCHHIVIISDWLDTAAKRQTKLHQAWFSSYKREPEQIYTKNLEIAHLNGLCSLFMSLIALLLLLHWRAQMFPVKKVCRSVSKSYPPLDVRTKTRRTLLTTRIK